MKTLTFVNLITLISILLGGGFAKAELSNTTLFSLNTMYIDRDYDDNGTKTKSKQTDTDLRLARIVKSWSFGAIYSMNSNDSSDSSRSSYGLSLGYHSSKDFYLNAHYFISSKYKLGGGTEYTKGSGYGVDLGFLTKVTSSFLVGLVVTHRNYTYTESSGSSGTASVDATHKELIPLFTFAVAFN